MIRFPIFRQRKTETRSSTVLAQSVKSTPVRRRVKVVVERGARRRKRISTLLLAVLASSVKGPPVRRRALNLGQSSVA